MRSFRSLRFLIGLLSVLVVTSVVACGGGGGGGGNTPPSVVAPTITTHPVSLSVNVGQPASFTVVAGGTAPLSYQWKKNGTDIPGASTATFYVNSVQMSDAGSYLVVVSNSMGSVTSSVATLTVNVPPTITTQPASVTVNQGQAASFSVVASGSMPLSYQWSKGSTAISGANSASYTTPATTTSDSGSTFTVVVSNSVGNVTSSAATLTVNPGTIQPVFTLHPLNQTVSAGAVATFIVSATGSPTPTIHWERSPDGANWSSISGATNLTYSFTTQMSDSGAKFRAKATNSAGTAISNTATLGVASIAIQATLGSVATQQSTQLTASVSGVTSPIVVWSVSSTDAQVTSTGPTTGTFTASRVRGNYTIGASLQGLSNVTTSTTVTVVAAPDSASGTVTLQPTVKIIDTATDAMLSAMTPAGLSFTGSPAAITSLQPGDVIYVRGEAREVVSVITGASSPITSPAQRKVLNGPVLSLVAADGTFTNLSTNPPALNNALSKANVLSSHHLGKGDLEQVQMPSGVHFSFPDPNDLHKITLTFDSWVLKDFDGDTKTTTDQISVNGSLTLDLVVAMDTNLDATAQAAGWHDISVEGSLDADITFSMSAVDKTWPEDAGGEYAKLRWLTLPVPIGVPGIILKFSFLSPLYKAALSGNAALEFKGSLRIYKGMRFEGTNFQAYGSGMTFPSPQVSLTDNGTVEAFAGISPVDVDLSTVGVDLAGLNTYVGVKLNASGSLGFTYPWTTTPILGTASVALTGQLGMSGYVNYPVLFPWPAWKTFNVSLFDLNWWNWSFPSTTPNKSPVAQLTGPTEVSPGAMFQLDASKSTDVEDGRPTKFTWSQTGGSSATPLGTSGAIALYKAPLNWEGTCTFQVVVGDSQGATGTNSIPVIVRTGPQNQSPILKWISTPPAVNGLVKATVNQMLTLDASSSTDPDGQVVTWNWKQVGGGECQMDGVNSSTFHVTPLGVGPIYLQLTIWDNNGATGTTVMTVQAEAQSGGSTTTFTLPGNVTLDLVPIPAGTFTMGSPSTEQDRNSNEGPLHQVTISAFSMAKFLTTQTQWVAVMGSNPSTFGGDLNCPVVNVSYNDITTATTGFLDKLNAATASTRPAGMVFRLPTEAEWEFAARADTTTRFYWGDDLSYTQIGAYAWYLNNSASTTHPVGTKLPNAWGLYDMAGNVWEWCQDWYGPYGGASQTDPAGPVDGGYRVARGGDWGDYDRCCRSAYRDYEYPNLPHNHFGFRVVLASPRTP